MWARVVEGWRDDRHRVDVRPGGVVWLRLREYVERRRAGQVRRLVATRYLGGRRYLHGVDPAGAPASRVAPREARIPVEVVGPYSHEGRMARAGEVIRVTVAEYRRYRGVDSLVRRFRRAEYRGRAYLAAVTTGDVERGCGCGKRRQKSP